MPSVVSAGSPIECLAAELAAQGASVLLLEAEDRPGYHTTGRSAAFWEECYGGPDVVPLTLASGPWLRENRFLSPRGALYIGREADAPALDAFIDGATEHKGSWWPDWLEWIRKLDAKEVPATGARVPGKGKRKAIEDAPGRYVKTR